MCTNCGRRQLDFNQTPWHSTPFYRDGFGGGEWLDEAPRENFLRSPVFVRQICCDTVYEKTLGSAVFVSGKKGSGKQLMYGLTGVPTFSAYTPFFADMETLHPAFAGIEAARLFEELDLHAFGKYQDFHPVSSAVFEAFETDILKKTDELTAASRLDKDGFSRKCAERLLSEARRVRELFWLYDLRLRQWGRERDFAERVPDIYALIDQPSCIGLPDRVITRPFAVRRNGTLFIDYAMGEREEYIPIEEASERYNFEWKDLPETGDLFIYRN